ncbi:MAG TPA: hypothetical protein VF335_09460, partial [Chitinivibrionales bacterium]
RNPLYDTIAGPLPDTLKANIRPYLVVGDLEVPVNKTVVIKAGAIFLFKNFSGIRILGKLAAQGTKEHPIIFTSENDRSVNPESKLYPNPYDWNGISIQKSGVGTTLSHCCVFYSVYGIESETKLIRLDPVTLRFNGKSNLVIEGKSRQVTEQAYYYVLSTKDAMSVGISTTFFKDPDAKKRELTRYSCYTLLIVSLIEGIESGLRYQKAGNDLKTSSEADRSDLQQTRKLNRNETIIWGAALALGAIGFYWTFTF